MSSIKKVYKETLAQEETNSLHPTYGLYDGISFDKVEYYRDLSTGKLWEVSYYTSNNPRADKAREKQRR